MNPSKLEREEDCCDAEPATRRNAPITIVTETTGAEKDRVTVTETEEVEKGDYSAVGATTGTSRGCSIA